MSLVVVVLSILGMHQLSIGHEVATPGPTASSALAESVHHSGSGRMLPPAVADHDHVSGGMSDPGPSGTCPDCVDHRMAFGSCLLALTLLVLSWLLTPPRPSHVLPFLLPRLVPTAAVCTVGRLMPPLSLAELSLRRT